MLDGGIL